MDADGPQHDSIQQRLRRLEEAVGFADHSNSELTRQLVDLDKKVRELAARMGRIEQRLGGVADAVAQWDARLPASDARGSEPAPPSA